jgi:hypothetical protein
MNTTWKAVIGIVLVFILGWFGGALTTIIIARHKALAIAQHNPEAITIMLERQTTHNLGLNDDQKKQLHALMMDNVKQRLELQKQIQPQVRSINQQTLQQIDAVLTPDQQERFRENLVLFKDRFGRNPFNVGHEGPGAAPTETPNVGPITNASAESK